MQETNLGLHFSQSKEFIEQLANWGQEFGPLLEKRGGLGQKRRRITLDYLGGAKEDVRAARLLRQRGLLSLSIYHLQQAVEKATKAYALDSGVMEPQDLRKKIGHTSPSAFLEILKDRWVVGYTPLLKLVYPAYKPDIPGVELIVKTQQKDIARLDKEAILKLLEFDKRAGAALKGSNTKSQISSTLDILPTILAGKFPQNQLVAGVKMVKKRLDMDMAMDFAISFKSLFLLSVITYPHFSFTRYPDGEIKPTDYVKGLGIVDCEVELLTLANDAIKTLEKSLTKQKKPKH
jgi:hypothetical protein